MVLLGNEIFGIEDQQHCVMVAERSQLMGKLAERRLLSQTTVTVHVGA